MSWKSESRRYGAVATAMHWATALAIFAMLVSGLTMDGMTVDAARHAILRVHAIVGIGVVALTLLRLAWWAFADRRPEEASGMPKWQARAAWLVHRLFYVVILVMGVSGMATLVLSGAASMLFAGGAGALPDFHQYPPRAAHSLLAWLLMALIALHVAAALYHQLVLRDRLLARMGLGRA